MVCNEYFNSTCLLDIHYNQTFWYWYPAELFNKKSVRSSRVLMVTALTVNRPSAVRKCVSISAVKCNGCHLLAISHLQNYKSTCKLMETIFNIFLCFRWKCATNFATGPGIPNGQNYRSLWGIPVFSSFIRQELPSRPEIQSTGTVGIKSQLFETRTNFALEIPIRLQKSRSRHFDRTTNWEVWKIWS